MNDPSQMMNRSFGIWPPLAPENPMGFPNQARHPPPFAAPGGTMSGRKMNWKAMKAAGTSKRAVAAGGGGSGGELVPMSGRLASLGNGVSGGYIAPALHELQQQNRVKARRYFHPKKKYARSAPFAPRNTTSFIIRAKKSGGIASLVSPYPVTPAVLPSPKLSPTREDLADMVKEEWGVDGYGSMKGLIRLRSPSGHEIRAGGGREDEDEDEEGSSESDVEEHLEVERRLDHDVSRFEMVYPGEEHGLESPSMSELLESRVNDQDAHIAHLEEENLSLKERLFLMERELSELRKRVLLLESRDYRVKGDDGRNNDNNIKDNGNKNKSSGGNGIEEENRQEVSDESSGAAMLE